MPSISYRPLPGTIEAMGADPVAQEPLKAGQRRFVVRLRPDGLSAGCQQPTG